MWRAITFREFNIKVALSKNMDCSNLHRSFISTTCLSRIVNRKTSNYNWANSYPKSGFYQARREILHWSTLHAQPSRTQATRRKLRHAQAPGDLDELRPVSVMVTTASFSRDSRATLLLQQFLLSKSIIAEKWLDYMGALNSWCPYLSAKL